MNHDEFEKLLKQVTQISRQEEAIHDFSECLSNEILEGILKGTITKDQRAQAMDHLAKCKYCRKDIEIYCELLESKNFSDILPDIAVFLNGKKILDTVVHWISKGKIFEIWNLHHPGQYLIEIGSQQITFECNQEDIIRTSENTEALKAAASEEKVFYSKQIHSKGGEIRGKLIPGKYAARLEVSLE